jgi:hypothetical protein
MITLYSFRVTASSKFSKGDQNVVGQGDNVPMRIDERCLAPFLFYIDDRHEKWGFAVDSSMKLEDLRESIFHLIIQDRIFRLIGI